MRIVILNNRYHVTGGVTPSHEWTEGLLDYYSYTGRREGLEGARSVAENILRHMAQPRMREPGASSVREGGWALRAMVGMWLDELAPPPPPAAFAAAAAGVIHDRIQARTSRARCRHERVAAYVWIDIPHRLAQMATSS